MHLLIVLLQQLLGMLPSGKKVLQPEVARKKIAHDGTPKPTGSEPDACARFARSRSWMTTVCQALSVFLKSPAGFGPHRPANRGRMRALRRAAAEPKAMLATFAERKATAGG